MLKASQQCPQNLRLWACLLLPWAQRRAQGGVRLADYWGCLLLLIQDWDGRGAVGNNRDVLGSPPSLPAQCIHHRFTTFLCPTYPRAMSAVMVTHFWALQIGGRNKGLVSSAGCCRMQLCCLPVPGVGQDATAPAEWLIFFLPGVLFLSFSTQYNYEVICITCTLCQILKIAMFETELLPFTVPHWLITIRDKYSTFIKLPVSRKISTSWSDESNSISENSHLKCGTFVPF